MSKDSILRSIGVEQDDTIMCVAGLGKPSVWKRFVIGENLSRGWSNCGRYGDGLCFIPTQPIKFAGFSIFASTEDTQFDIKYEVKLESEVVAKYEGKSSPWEDTYFSRYMLEELIDVPAGGKLFIIVFIAKSMSDNSYTNTFSGSDGSGEEYKTLENEHVGLFELDSHPDSSNGTSKYSGHFPEIFYHVA